MSSNKEKPATVNPVKRRPGRPPKGPDALTVKLQLRVTAGEDREIAAAVAVRGGEFSEWARPVLVGAARKDIEKARKR